MHSLLIRFMCQKVRFFCCQSGILFQSGPINLLQPYQFSNCVCCWPHCADSATWFLANVNSRSRSLYAIARQSVVCRR